MRERVRQAHASPARRRRQGTLNVSILVPVAGDVAAAAPVPRRRTRAHRALHLAGAMKRLLLLFLLAAALCAAATAPAKRADGDPASDYLLAAEGLPLLRARLQPAARACADEARRAGEQAGFRHPRRGHRQRIRPGLCRPDMAQGERRRARFLGAELGFVYKRRRLVVMPNGFGFNWPKHSPKARIRGARKMTASRAVAPACSRPPSRPSRHSPKAG